MAATHAASRNGYQPELSGGLTAVGLFSGIGGLEAGLARAGHQSILLAENEPAACAVLSERFPGIPNAGDIRKLKDLPAGIELLAGGFPCQDLSQAGETRGIGGGKSSIVGEVFRLVRKQRVPYLVLENVPFMLQLNRGEAMRHIVAELENLGYRWAYRVIDSRAFGLPQRRERVFLIASTRIDPATALFRDDAGPMPQTGCTGTAYGFYWTEGSRGLGWAVDSVPTLKGGSSIGIPSPPAIWLPDGRIATPDIRDAERLQGFEADWTRAARDAGKASFRWKLVGNAVTVPAAEWIGRVLRDNSSGMRFRGSGAPDSGAWPKAAFGGPREGRFIADVSTWPVRHPFTPVAQFLDYDAKPLSRKATEGFMRRLRASCLRYPEAFWFSLARHLESMNGTAVPPPDRFARQMTLPVPVAS